MLYLYVFISFILGGLVTSTLFNFNRIRLINKCAMLEKQIIMNLKLAENKQVENVKLNSEFNKRNNELSHLNLTLNRNVENSKEEINVLRDKLLKSDVVNARIFEREKNLQESLIDQKQEIIRMKDSFSKEFEILANKILDEKTLKFTEQNKNNLKEILTPFNDRILEFKGSIEKSNYTNSRERIELSEHIKQLMKLNSIMQKETKNLTKALTGDNKIQGNWGEVVLERVLEYSGLVKDREYFTQQSFSKEDNLGYLRPDVIIKLPEGKNLIVDSKVSLTAYNVLINSDNLEQKESALKAHVVSVRSHINNLAGKNYQFLEGVTTPDFVLLFMPIESSFSIATQSDYGLFEYAWSKKIVIVSPSTLLATLKTIASVWKSENQNKNAMEIANKAGKLYDKFFGFIEDLEKIGKNLKIAEESYNKAFSKLKEGRGSAISIAQKMVELGAKPKKKIPERLL